jgi:MFS family permease
MGIGGSAIVPLLPTYLVAHGSSPAGVGLVMGSFFFAQLLGQYPAGWAVDRFGFRPVAVFGLVTFAVGCIGFALFHDPAVAIAFRSLQGVGDGAFAIAAVGAIGLTVPAGERGRAFTFFNAAMMLSFAIGPVIGGAVGSSSIPALFFGAGGLALGAVGVTRLLPRVVPTPARSDDGAGGGRAEPLIFSRALVGASLALGATGVVGGLYEGVWSLLLHSRGVPSFGIALSWTIYCLPYAVVAPFAVRIALGTDRRLLAFASIISSGIFASIYPAISDGTILIYLGAAEAVTAVFVTPAAQSIISEHVSDDLQGRAQAVAGSLRTGALAVGAYGSGLLFGVAHPLPFHAATAALVLLAVGAAIAWRGLAGRTDQRVIEPLSAAGPPA